MEVTRLFGAAMALVLLAGCANSGAHEPTAAPSAAVSVPAIAPVPPPSPAPAVSSVAPPPTYHSSVSKIVAADVPYTWRAGCPVGLSQLRRVTLTYWGFDDRAHTGSMIVNAAVVADVTKVFGILYRDRFPIRQMRPEDVYKGQDPVSMAADNTSGFNCRYAVAPGPKSWSEHAYGEAIDVNTVENPYVEAGQVMPAAGQAYLDRSHYRPGMAVKGGTLVAAFASVGWQWGGRWSSSPDYQHFSKNGG